ncbi:uncharacterized protein LOC143878734 [Tasmannia lanceolata]|uniref:uncharacterized protein LOC143878734 n=1 Tax=Tasmannia lanceolata TaxID=3420 RepID=UPI004063B297
MAISAPVFDISAQLQLENTTDPELLKKHDEVTKGIASPEFSVRNGFIFHNSRFFIGSTSPLRYKILHEFHSTPQSANLILQPLPVPLRVWEDVAMDFITQLPLSYGFTTIMVVIDRLSNIPSPIRWPDGQSEVLNRCVEQYLRAFSQDNPRNWQKYLLWAEYSYNTSFHNAIQMTPFEAVYGRTPPTIQMYIPGTYSIEAVDAELLQRDEVLSRLKANLIHAKARMKDMVDVKRVDKNFDKLSKRYYGPYEILAKVGQVAYKLRLPEESRIHPVFHVSQLKQFYGPTPQSICTLPAKGFNNQPVVTPLAILGTRVVLQNDTPVQQVLVQWHGLLPEDTSWKNLAILQSDYPHLNLEDKVTFQGVGNDSIHEVSEPELQQSANELEVSNEDRDRAMPKDQSEDSRAQRVKQKSVGLKDYM